MLEDVLVKVVHLYLLTDFIIIDIEEDFQVPIVVGRPFLCIVDAIIDVKKGMLTLEVGNERIEFIMKSILKDPYTKVSCCLVDVIKIYDETRPE